MTFSLMQSVYDVEKIALLYVAGNFFQNFFIIYEFNMSAHITFYDWKVQFLFPHYWGNFHFKKMHP